MQPRLVPSIPLSQRLGYYLLGLAIGLMVVGMIVSARSRAMHAPADPAAPPSASTPAR
jgi:hypothetical protein